MVKEIGRKAITVLDRFSGGIHYSDKGINNYLFWYKLHTHARWMLPMIGLVGTFLTEVSPYTISFFALGLLSMVRVNQIYAAYANVPLSSLQKSMRRIIGKV